MTVGSFSSIASSNLLLGYSCRSFLILVTPFRSLVYIRNKAFCPSSQLTSNFSPVYPLGESDPKCHIVTIQESWSGIGLDSDDDDSDSGRGVSPKVRPYVARVKSFSEECRSFEGGFLTSEQFAEFKKDLQNRCNSAGIPWFSNSPPGLTGCGFCIVDNINGFVIGPNGRLLKCWTEASNKKGTGIGHLLKEQTWDCFTDSPLQNRDPFDDPGML